MLIERRAELGLHDPLSEVSSEDDPEALLNVGNTGPHFDAAVC
jgi:hypothetical protein